MSVVHIELSWEIEADVTLEDGSIHHVGPFGPRDLIAAERKFGIPFDLIRQMPRTEHVAFCAWNQLQRQHSYNGSFDSFVERLAEMEANFDVPDPPKKESPEDEAEEEEPGLVTVLSPNGSP